MKRVVLLALGLSMWTSNASAVDGAIEISDVVHITEPGSYVLVNDIVVSRGIGMSIRASDVTLDLNGFTIRYGAGGVVDGLVLDPNHSNFEVKNGSIVGFARYGVFAPGGGPDAIDAKLVNLRVVDNGRSGIELQGRPGLIIEGCVVSNNGGNGIRGGRASLVRGNVVSENGGWGLIGNSSVGYQSNVFFENGSGDVLNARNLGSNLCTSRVCP
ncbi:MAG: right-handed parallel beta-helix repeat-containing protein [Proteobacteria bacterium]|nr:right-handed parallel beta-helix repeat-containing protein [Pseudomonadota bacterium]